VLSANYSSVDLPMGPATYALDDKDNKDLMVKQSNYKGFVESLGLVL
jgi:hypothetical protein